MKNSWKLRGKITFLGAAVMLSITAAAITRADDVAPADNAATEQVPDKSQPAAKATPATPPRDEAAEKQAAKVAADKLSDKQPAWAESLADGRKAASESGCPLLVRVGAPWCGWCTKLHDEMEKAEVAEELRRWSLAYVDSDDAPADARQLGVGPIPALRVLNASGKIVAEQDGYLPAEPLLAWLKSAYEDAAGEAPAVLVAKGAPTPDEVTKLIESFGEPRVARREAAMRRLLPHRGIAGASVAGAFANKKLAVRLAALELLGEWRAPVDGLDPWRPETLTPERLKAVDEWASSAGEAPVDSMELSPEQLAAAREQLGRLVVANEEDAAAIAERLARFGPRLSALVSGMLNQVTIDRERERLLTLRYRLAATDARALNWPSGLKRLASSEVKVRRAAAEELVAKATADDEPLLSEVFSDPDALVREICLRGLQAAGGDKAGGALVRLLSDPDPNVRAAVLKQLTEDPSADYVKSVAAYALQEPDADLVLHAVRCLKEAGSPAAVPPLLKLLEHPSWQVRAEAAEALTKKSGRHSSRPADAQQAVDIYTALIERLSDEDGFVVSRAVEGLRKSELVAAAKPLAAAAEKHPELATEIISTLVQSAPLRTATLPTLRKFAEHQDPRIRAGALAGLITAGEDSDGELAIAGLADADAKVRRDVANSVFELCQQVLQQKNQKPRISTNRSRPQPSTFGKIFGSLFGGPAKDKAAADEPQAPVNAAEAWLIGFHDGKGRPKWMLRTVEPLERMFASENAQERLAAALPLTALGHGEQTLPVLLALTQTEGIPREALAPALPWLLWPARVALFDAAMQSNLNPSQVRQYCERLAASRDPRAAELLWKMLARQDASVQLADSVYDALRQLSPSNGSDDPFDGDVFETVTMSAADDSDEMPEVMPDDTPGETPDGEKPAAAEAATPEPGAPETAAHEPAAPEPDEPALGDEEGKRPVAATDDADSPRREWLTYASQGTPWQRNIALALLIADRDTVRKLATAILDDPQTEDEFRADALQLLLLSLGPKLGEKLAVERLGSANPRIAKCAVMYLVQGPDSIRALRGTIYINSSHSYYSSSPAGVAIEVDSPKGLKEQDVRKLLASDDPEVVAGAGYLLATLQEGDGIDAIIAQWRKDPSRHEGWARALYRSIAAVDDDSRTPILREINGKLDAWSKREFYWTIRTMHGPEILKLRKEIRDTVGMDSLR